MSLDLDCFGCGYPSDEMDAMDAACVALAGPMVLCQPCRRRVQDMLRDERSALSAIARCVNLKLLRVAEALAFNQRRAALGRRISELLDMEGEATDGSMPKEQEVHP
ncbi:MAG: hypothetical protein BWX88_02667 [Planctomycetes bacterium ADurb.Bin126]|nr:MAG: hypothetical protein BWX88_02667 [Planctomycetes bacterium ADurb.Bin126]HOD79982.1 hypothetical protein [Phycisphaerae bacterium]HQL74039.1 hypothetical protein [Phycisphaerae bacterium]